MIEVADPINKETHYTYDSAGRRTAVGAGTLGDFDPTEYFYSSTTGLLEKVRYHADTSYDDALYYYDGMARLDEIDDWISSTPGDTLRYAYDAAGRMTTITDYDDSTLDYTYDAAGNVTNMDDYHGNDTSYTYDDAGRLTSMTAPGSRTWNFSYNALNQPTVEELPNGMASFYSYDTRNRLASIDHQDALVSGTTVLGFDYTRDDVGNITRIDENDGGFWEYTYDGRNRLTDAVYTNDWGHEAVYDYTYDNGDNMTQKVEPFHEDWNDGNTTGWTAYTGTWSATNGYLTNTVSTTGFSDFYKAKPTLDGEIRFSYYSEDTSSNGYYLRILLRNATTERTDVRFYPDKAVLWDMHNSAWTLKDQDTGVTTTQGTWYDVVAKLDGANVTIWRAERGQQLQEVLSTTSSAATSNSYFWLQVPANAQFRCDEIRVMDGAMQSTWAMTSNNANELTQMQNSAQGTTITYDYDDKGRTVEKAMGTKTALYEWAYGNMLSDVDTDFIDEADVSYSYGGDGKRRGRLSSGITAVFKWAGWQAIQEESGVGNLQKTYVYYPKSFPGSILSTFIGGSPALADESIFLHDHLGSTHHIYDGDKELVAYFEYAPYGEVDHREGGSLEERQYTEHVSEPTGLYFAPFRHYNPDTGKWLSRDPWNLIDGPNLYSYVTANPIAFTDPLGASKACDCYGHQTCQDCCDNIFANLVKRKGGRVTPRERTLYSCCSTACTGHSPSDATGPNGRNKWNCCAALLDPSNPRQVTKCYKN